MFELTGDILDRAADLWVAQKRRGRPVPEVDLFIAATAAVEGIPVATRDTDFLEIDGVDVAWWGEADPESCPG